MAVHRLLQIAARRVAAAGVASERLVGSPSSMACREFMSSTPMARLDRIELVVVVPCIVPTQVIFAAFLLPACEGARRDPPPFSSMNSTPAFLSTDSILSSDFWSPA